MSAIEFFSKIGGSKLGVREKILNMLPNLNSIAEIMDLQRKENVWNCILLLKGDQHPISISFHLQSGLVNFRMSNINADREWICGILDVAEKFIPTQEIKKGPILFTVDYGGRTMSSKIAESIDLNLTNNMAKINIALKGESDPITVSAKFNISGDILQLSDVNANKKWLSALIDITKDKYSSINLEKQKGIKSIINHLL